MSFLRYGEAIIGKGYDVIIVDDPQSPSQVEDGNKREQAAEYFRNDVLHRLNSKKDGGIVIVQQRLHQSDLTGSVVHRSEWHCLAISAVSRKNEKWSTPRGGFVTRNKDEALCEERESRKTIEEQLELMGAAKFSCQYLQAPILGIERRPGNGKAWDHPREDWDGKKYIPWIMLSPSPVDQLLHIKELYFDGPPSPYIFEDPNPEMTLEEFAELASAHQAALVQRV